MDCRVSVPSRVWGTTFAVMRWAIAAARAPRVSGGPSRPITCGNAAEIAAMTAA